MPHLVATAVERVALLSGLHLVFEVSAIWRCSAGAGLLREQVERHLVVLHGGGTVLEVDGAVSVLRREQEIVRCVLGTEL